MFIGFLTSFYYDVLKVPIQYYLSGTNDLVDTNLGGVFFRRLVRCSVEFGVPFR